MQKKEIKRRRPNNKKPSTTRRSTSNTKNIKKRVTNVSSKEEKQAYINDMAELYSMGYSAEGLFESFAGQPLDDTKRTQEAKAGEILSRRRSFECFKRAQ